ncbi:hypothetical protein [Burkholderia cenocepacia]|uniref:hypothetical protein n=1 Tax=Burkholderia cenocepacia TaxID=95486 RepID=UPI001B916BF1|nr:hypothetical protein [Burkholderia cenocepacia]MBR8427291.1 hypothetical protein [Burkholderia cenocepacia]
MQIDASTFDDIVKSMVRAMDAQHQHVKTITGGGEPVQFRLGLATASSALAAALQEHGIAVSDSDESERGSKETQAHVTIEEMTVEQLNARADLLSSEMDANDVENVAYQNEINAIYARIDVVKSR